MINIVDTTLREAKQLRGRIFTQSEEAYIARLLDSLGFYQLEIGIPGLGSVEQETIARIAHMGLMTRVNTWNRLLLGDIRASIACGVRDIHISAPVSALRIHSEKGRNHLWILDCLKRAMRYASEWGCRITVGAEDASRAETEFLLEYAWLAQDMGALRFRYCDTDGLLNESSTIEKIEWLRENINLELEFHVYNDLKANANAQAAISAGITYINTSISGFCTSSEDSIPEQLKMAFKSSDENVTRRQKRTFRFLNRYMGRASNRLAS